MDFLKNYTLSSRETKLIYILIVVLVAFGIFNLQGMIFEEPVQSGQNLEELRQEQKELSLFFAEVLRISNENSLLEQELALLRNETALLGIDASFVISGAYATDINISNISKKEQRHNEHYYTNEYLIEVKGTYPGIVEFIARLEQNQASKVTSINISRDVETMEVNGVISWEVYSLFGSEPQIPDFVPNERGRKDAFYIPHDFVVFLQESDDEESGLYDVSSESTDSGRYFFGGSLSENIVTRSNGASYINDTKAQEDIEFLQENSYSFPVRIR